MEFDDEDEIKFHRKTFGISRKNLQNINIIFSSNINMNEGISPYMRHLCIEFHEFHLDNKILESIIRPESIIKPDSKRVQL